MTNSFNIFYQVDVWLAIVSVNCGYLNRLSLSFLRSFDRFLRHFVALFASSLHNIHFLSFPFVFFLFFSERSSPGRIAYSCCDQQKNPLKVLGPPETFSDLRRLLPGRIPWIFLTA